VTAAVPLESHQEQLFAADAETARWKQFPALIERLSNRLGEQAVLRSRLWPDHQPEFACRYAPWLREKASEPSAVRRRVNSKSEIRNKSKIRNAKQNRLEFRASNLFRISDFEYRISPWLRPPWLTAQPIAIPVMSVIPGGPPLRFEWKNQSHVVAHYWGPERIETGWWREQGVRRDYYLVETAAGKRFWLFRTMGDEVWFLHGMFG
jgi:protein ImuB